MNRINNMNNKISTPNKQKKDMYYNNDKGSNSTFCSISSIGTKLIYFISFVLVLVGFDYLYDGDVTFLQYFNSSDRASNYNVKIFSNVYTDKQLNELNPTSFSYLAMIDAGSSGCRAHVYRYGKLETISGPLYILPQHVSFKVKPGLSSFATNPTNAGQSLQGLVEFLKKEVPQEFWADTPIWLKATAGLRMLKPEESLAVLKSVKDYLGNPINSPFLFRRSYASIISGQEEGGFGWIAYNYLKKLIGPKKVPNGPSNSYQHYAVVEMGGASSQVTQITPTKSDEESIPKDYLFKFIIEGESFSLYTHSYLGFGAEQARSKFNKKLEENVANNVVNDPCLNTGFIRAKPENVANYKAGEVYDGPGGSSYSVAGSGTKDGACSVSLSNLLFPSKDVIKDNKCIDKSPHSFGCVYQPLFVKESVNFLVFENFYYMSSALAVQPKGHVEPQPTLESPPAVFPLLTSPREIREVSNDICGLTWDKIESSYPKDSQPKDTNTKWCFSSSYASSFLIDGLGINEDKTLTIQKEVDGSEIEWALGAAYKEIADFLKRTNLRTI